MATNNMLLQHNIGRTSRLNCRIMHARSNIIDINEMKGCQFADKSQAALKEMKGCQSADESQVVLQARKPFR